MEGAARNLAAEAPEDDFDKYLAVTRKNWNEQLSKIEITCDDPDENVKFYTALYHSMLAPTIYNDVDGIYYGPDKQVHQADGWTITVLFRCGIPIVPLILFITYIEHNV